MKVEQGVVQEFIEKQGKNPVHWVITASDEDLKKVSVAAFHQIHNTKGSQDPDSVCGPRLIFYNEGRHHPILQGVRR